MKYIVCNLKANKTKEELMIYASEVAQLKTSADIELIICPSTPFLYLFQNNNYKLGSQDVSIFSLGPHTGENTAEQLASLNVKYALIGHSERRKLFKEEEKTIIEKIKKSYHSHISPIYFIGEKEEEKEQTKRVLGYQITKIINEVPEYKRPKMILVYEPVWAIGTGLIPTVEEIRTAVKFIKNSVKKYYDLQLPVLYGGSVNEENVADLMNITELDGFVLGESSKEYSEVEKIYKKMQKTI